MGSRCRFHWLEEDSGRRGGGMGNRQGCSASVGLSRTTWPWLIPGLQPGEPALIDGPSPSPAAWGGPCGGRFPLLPDTGLPPMLGVVQRVVWAHADSDGPRAQGLGQTGAVGSDGHFVRERPWEGQGLGSHLRDPKTISSNGFW